MITRLRAQNFKSWKDTGDLRIAPLTGLFGTNSSGKTSILQALLVLKQSAESPDPRRVLDLGNDRSLVDVGTFFDVIHGHDTDLELKFSLSWKADSEDGRLDAAFTEKGDRLRLSNFEYSQGGSVATIKEGPQGLTLKRQGPILTATDGPEVGVASPWGFHSASLAGAALGLQLCLERINYLGPLRQRPRRSPQLWSGSTPSDVGPDGSEFAQAMLSTRGKQITVERVASALKKMNLIDSFRIERVAPDRRDYEIRLKKTHSSAEVLLPDVGFGISQILPVLVLCYYAAADSTLIIEQPELHLHPAAQSALADVLIDVVNRRSIQIIVESHSEHLLRRLQRRIAEGQFAAHDAALYFCEMDNGASKCTSLEVTEDGFIKNWPKDFFGDEMGDLAAITEGAMNRRLHRTK